MGTKVIVIVKDRQKPLPKLEWTIGPVSEQKLDEIGVAIPMLQLTETQQCALSVSPVTRKGNPAQVQNPTWSSSDDAVVTVDVDSTDSLKAKVVAEAPGTAQVNFSADADLGDGVRLLSAVLDVTVVPGEAVTVTIATGTPEEQP